MPIKVLLVSNWHDTCGISTYGDNLLLALEKNDEVSVTPIEVGGPSDQILIASETVDVVHLNWQTGVSRTLQSEWIEKCSKPVVLTNHYTEWKEPWYKYLSGLVIHVPLTEQIKRVLPPTKIRYVPHGVVATELSSKTPDSLVIGQGGVPGAIKKTEILCWAARELKVRGVDVSVYIIAPETYRSHPKPYIEMWKDILVDVPSEISTEWYDQYTTIQKLHDNISVCVHPGGNVGVSGISGSVRMSISTCRPVVINAEAILYSDLLDVEGIYPYTGTENLSNTILEAYGNVGPERFLKDNSFQEIIKQYISLYKEVM